MATLVMFLFFLFLPQAITGDFESHFALLVRARREQRDHQTISDYRLQVERLRGRINVMADHRDSTAVIKFDGWPEVNQKKKDDDKKGMNFNFFFCYRIHSIGFGSPQIQFSN